MRLRVVHDETGRIVAAAILPEGDDGVAAVPLAGVREAGAEVDVPQDMAAEDLDVICTRLRVDPANNQLVPAPLEGDSSG